MADTTSNLVSKDVLYLSFGENCLPDDILKRHGIKSFTTPYSHGRSNVEYILQLENDKYKNFLNPDYFVQEELDGKPVLRLNDYNHIQNIYEKSCMKGFEFTHHDVKNNSVHRDAFTRRVNRMVNLKSKSLFIFYHHRYCKTTNMDKLLEDLYRLRILYHDRCRQVQVVMFTQNIVKEPSERKLEYKFTNGIHTFIFNTLTIWTGREYVWARNDDDLIQVMLNMVTNGELQQSNSDRMKAFLKGKLLKYKLI